MNIKIFITLIAMIMNKNWCDHNNYNYCTPMQNQFLPNGCENGELIMATISTISDLLNIRNKGRFPEIILSPQLLICNLKEISTCDKKFEVKSVLDEIKTNGLVDDTCLLYKGDETHCPQNAMNVCDNNTHLRNTSERLFRKKEYTNYKINKYEEITTTINEESLINGPILCSMDVPEDFHTYTKEKANFSLFENNTKEIFVSIVGYEADENKNYYIVRTSYGEQFGDNGFFKTYTDQNQLKTCYNIELEDTKDHKIFEYNLNQNKKEVKKVIKADDEVKYIDEVNYFDHCVEWDSQKNCIKKLNLLTPIKSQANTGNCWAFAAIAALQDRIMLKNYRIRLGIDGYTKDENQSIEKIVLSEQSIVNHFNGGSGTGGGDSKIVYSRLSLKEWDGPDYNDLIVSRKTCTNFKEEDPKTFRKDFSQICSTKDGKEYNFLKDNKLNNLGYKIKNYTYNQGKEKIKNALKDGPVSCGVNAGAFMKAMSENKDLNPKMVIEKKIKKVSVDHDVVIVGYGKVVGGSQNGYEYWLIRNSWSVGWNDNGLFKLRIGKNNFGIETNCSAAIL